MKVKIIFWGEGGLRIFFTEKGAAGQISLRSTELEHQFVIHENKNFLDCCMKVGAKFARVCNLEVKVYLI